MNKIIKTCDACLIIVPDVCSWICVCFLMPHFLKMISLKWMWYQWSEGDVRFCLSECDGLAAVWQCVLSIWGTNTRGALISNRSSPPLLLMACGSFLRFLLLSCTQSIDGRLWPAPRAHCVIGSVCVCRWLPACVSTSEMFNNDVINRWFCVWKMTYRGCPDTLYYMRYMVN